MSLKEVGFVGLYHRRLHLLSLNVHRLLPPPSPPPPAIPECPPPPAPINECPACPTPPTPFPPVPPPKQSYWPAAGYFLKGPPGGYGNNPVPYFPFDNNNPLPSFSFKSVHLKLQSIVLCIFLSLTFLCFFKN
ncbi:leucine-rich repeat extensin-like protein 3 [Populus alba x Populus x berolinensis]|nr:leucine-rich repeat extensin-like protein 3 [Populus alba x Populus x berolinensis]